MPPVATLAYSPAFSVSFQCNRNATRYWSTTIDADAILEDARDVVVRFGAHLDSLKGRPIDPKLFFRGEAPSILARRRLTKLAAALGHIADEFEKHKDKIRDPAHWRSS